MTNAETRAYSQEHIDLLKKADLIGEGIIRLQCKVSTSRRPYSPDGRTWTVNPVNGRPDVDRTRVIDRAVPIRQGNSNIIMGYWKNKVSKAEADILIQELGIPEYHLASGEVGSDNRIPDTEIILTDGKEWDLSDPIQKAEWDVVQHSDLIAKSEAEAWSSDWASFWYINTGDVIKQQHKDNKKKLKFILDANSLSDDEKALNMMLMYYRGYYNIESIDTAATHHLATLFDGCILSHPDDLRECIETKDKLMYLNLYKLIRMGRIEAFGHSGPYHLERTHSAQERGKLLGNTTEEAVQNLKSHDNIHLLSYLKRGAEINVEAVESNNIQQRIRTAALNSMTMEKAATMNKTSLSNWLVSVGVDVDPAYDVKMLREKVSEVLDNKE